MILDLMLDFHAWSTCRPTHESDMTADKLEKDINGIMETEKEQGRSLAPPAFPSFVGRRTFYVAPRDVCLRRHANTFLSREDASTPGRIREPSQDGFGCAYRRVNCVLFHPVFAIACYRVRIAVLSLYRSVCMQDRN